MIKTINNKKAIEYSTMAMNYVIDQLKEKYEELRVIAHDEYQKGVYLDYVQGVFKYVEFIVKANGDLYVKLEKPNENGEADQIIATKHYNPKEHYTLHADQDALSEMLDKLTIDVEDYLVK